MKLAILAAAVIVTMPALVVKPTFAAESGGHLGTAQQQRACRTDVARHCASVHEDQAIADCLAANKEKLTRSCRRVMEEGGR